MAGLWRTYGASLLRRLTYWALPADDVRRLRLLRPATYLCGGIALGGLTALRFFDGRLTGLYLRRTYAGYAYYDQRLTCAGHRPPFIRALPAFHPGIARLSSGHCPPFIPPLADFHPAFGGLSSRLWRTFIPPLADFHPAFGGLSSRLWRAHALPWVFLLDVFLGLL